jgi:hypothetical protein
MSSEETTTGGTASTSGEGQNVPEQQTGSSGQQQAKPGSEAVEQARRQALSPTDKHKNYLDDLERLHDESKVNEYGKTNG